MRVPLPTAVDLSSALALSVAGASVHAAEITVCSGGCNYTSIHDAVDDASPGDTLPPEFETFCENVVAEPSG